MPRILRFRELLCLKGVHLSRRHIDKLCREGRFPQKIQYPDGSIGWCESDIDAWVESKGQTIKAKP